MSEKEKKVRELSAEEVLQKFDKESDKRELTGVWGKIISAICILFALFQLYTATFGVLDAHLQRAIHLAFGFLLIFLLYPSRHSWSRSKMHPFDAFLALLSAGTAMYLVVNYQELVLRAGMNTETDFIVGLIGTIMVFEAARRVVGWPMIIVAFCFMLYAFLLQKDIGFLLLEERMRFYLVDGRFYFVVQKEILQTFVSETGHPNDAYASLFIQFFRSSPCRIIIAIRFMQQIQIQIVQSELFH